MEYDPRVSAACDALRQPCRHGSRVVRPNVLIAWWTYDDAEFYAVAEGPAGRSVVRSATHCANAQSYALAAYIRGAFRTYNEEQEWA